MRILLSWILFYVGALISIPMNRFDWAWLYTAYNKLMIWSLEQQLSAKGRRTGQGPWKYNG